jgi:hypothetical protein
VLDPEHNSDVKGLGADLAYELALPQQEEIPVKKPTGTRHDHPVLQTQNLLRIQSIAMTCTQNLATRFRRFAGEVYPETGNWEIGKLRN